jgi:hypothetical protein
VSHRKYHTWCSSSIKLLDERLTSCNNVPTTKMAWSGRNICVQMYNISRSRQIICDQTFILRSLRSGMVIFGAPSLNLNIRTHVFCVLPLSLQQSTGIVSWKRPWLPRSSRLLHWNSYLTF